MNQKTIICYYQEFLILIVKSRIFLSYNAYSVTYIDALSHGQELVIQASIFLKLIKEK